MKNSPLFPQNPQGIFISHGVKLESHEIDTINFFVRLGERVEQILPSNTPHNKRPDIFMRGLIWEIKSPTNNSIKSLEKLFYRASQQSPNIIFDLRRAKIKNEKVIINKLTSTFIHARKSKNFLIITKSNQLLEINKKH